MKRLTLKEIFDLCVEYDKENGGYPESPFEGYTVFQFIKSKITGRPELYEEDDYYDKYLK